jgi:hypothetical protein
MKTFMPAVYLTFPHDMINVPKDKYNWGGGMLYYLAYTSTFADHVSSQWIASWLQMWSWTRFSIGRPGQFIITYLNWDLSCIYFSYLPNLNFSQFERHEWPRVKFEPETHITSLIKKIFSQQHWCNLFYYLILETDLFYGVALYFIYFKLNLFLLFMVHNLTNYEYYNIIKNNNII